MYTCIVYTISYTGMYLKICFLFVFVIVLSCCYIYTLLHVYKIKCTCIERHLCILKSSCNLLGKIQGCVLPKSVSPKSVLNIPTLTINPRSVLSTMSYLVLSPSSQFWGRKSQWNSFTFVSKITPLDTAGKPTPLTCRRHVSAMSRYAVQSVSDFSFYSYMLQIFVTDTICVSITCYSCMLPLHATDTCYNNT